MTDLDLVKALHKSSKYTCILCRGVTVYTSINSGISWLLDMVESGTDLRGFTAWDKIVGKAAAMLYVSAEVKDVFATVMSKQAAELFSKHGIQFSYNIMTPTIINRSGTDICPMEHAVMNIENPTDAKNAIKYRMQVLLNKCQE